MVALKVIGRIESACAIQLVIDTLNLNYPDFKSYLMFPP